MGRNRFGLQFDGWQETMAKLDKLGGSDAMKKGTEAALNESKDYVNGLISNAMGKLPAGGKYSTGRTAKSLDTDKKIEWQAMKASAEVGFKFKESGLTSIFLMYGTPRMRPASGLKAAIYGAKTQKEVAKIQSEAIDKVIKSIMEG